VQSGANRVRVHTVDHPQTPLARAHMPQCTDWAHTTHITPHTGHLY